MRATDFEFDGLRLSDKNFMICRFDGGGTDTIAGSEITFNTVAAQHGAINYLTSTEFSDCLTFTLQICKNLCDGTGEKISIEDMRDMTRWLNRKEYCKFKLLNDELSGVYFNVSFNISKIEINGELYGFELEGFTNAPFARAEDITLNIDAKTNETINIYNKSDDFGYVYPHNMVITIEEDGDLEIINHMENRTMIIKNCVQGEVITLDYPMISSSLGDERETKIANDFNWNFFRLASTFKNRLNEVTITIPCNIKLTYSPAVKIWI